MIHLHQNILSFIHIMVQKSTTEKVSEISHTIQVNNITCLAALKQLCKAINTKEYDHLDKLLRKIEVSTSVRVAAVIAFDQELKMIGIDKIVSLMTPTQDKKKEFLVEKKSKKE